jgi:hypothetical protein
MMIERRFGKQTHLIEKEDHTILQIRTLNIQKTNFVEKGIGTILLEHQFKKNILKYYKPKIPRYITMFIRYCLLISFPNVCKN